MNICSQGLVPGGQSQSATPGLSATSLVTIIERALPSDSESGYGGYESEEQAQFEQGTYLNSLSQADRMAIVSFIIILTSCNRYSQIVQITSRESYIASF